MKFLISFFCASLVAINGYCQEPVLIDSIKYKINNTFDESQLIGYYNDLAWEYSMTNYDSSEKYTDISIQLAEKLKDPYWLAVSYEMKAILFELSGQPEIAIEMYMKVIDIREKSSKEGIENTFNNVAILFRTQNNHQKALEYFSKSYEIESKNENTRGIIASFVNMAVSLKELRLLDSSFLLNKKALDMAISTNDEEYIVYSSVNMGEHYVLKGIPDSVLYYNSSVIGIARKLKLYGPLAVILQTNADVYVDRGDYKRALIYLDEADDLAAKVNIAEILRPIYQSKAKAYEGLKMFDRAYEYAWKYVRINDSIINDQTIKVLNELEKKYETAKKDESIAKLNETNAINKLKTERQAYLIRLISIAGGFFIFMTIFIMWFLRQRLKNQKLLALKNEEIKTAEFKRYTVELEMKALRAQMNPHFIFNCMNSINKMILNGESETASRYLNKFSKLIRLTLENSENTTITLEDELSMLEAYIQLEAVRFKGKINHKITVDDSIDQSGVQLPSMVLQPFIENAIWHGLMHKEEPGNIKINIKEEGDELKCTIEDDGVGREMALKLTEKSPQKNKSLGIKITEERLKLLNKQKISEWVQIIDLKDQFNNAIGTKVNISIPIS